MKTTTVPRRRPSGRTALFAILAATVAAALAPAVARAQPCTAPVTGSSGFQRVPLVSGLEEPMSFQEDPATGRIFLVEKAGAFKVFDPVDTSITTIATLPVVTDAELGLLGLALDPAYSTNHWVFLYFTEMVAGQRLGTLSRFTLTESPSWSLGDRHDLLTIPHVVNYHDAGDLKFGPDGNLYLSTGSNDFAFTPLYPGCDYGNAASDCAKITSSEKNDLRGKIIRITPTAAGSYTVPSGNMFPPAAGQKSEFLSMGHRNPFRFSIDPVIPSGATIPTLYVAEVGTRYEEINRVTGSGYYGWPIDEGPCPAFYPPIAGLPTDIDPWLWYHQDADGSCQAPMTSSIPAPGIPNLFDAVYGTGKSVMAGPVYHYNAGATNPRRLPITYDKDLFFWDFSKGLVYNVNMTAAGAITSVERFAADIDFHESNIVDMELGRDDALYILERDQAQISRLDFAPPGTNASPIAYITATPAAGSAPLTVLFNACGSPSACTHDPDAGDVLTYSWDFEGDGIPDASGVTATHVYPAGAANAVLSVTDNHGAKTTAGTRIVSGNQPSTVTFSGPPDGGLFNWGDTVSVGASVTDPEDGSTPPGAIPCSALEITSYLGHDTHRHNIHDVWACSDSFTLEDATGKDQAFYYYAFRAQYQDNPVLGVPSVKSSSTITLWPKRVEAEQAELGPNLRVAPSSVPFVGGGKVLSDIDDGDYLVLRSRNLQGITGYAITAANGAGASIVEVHVDSPGSSAIGSVNIPNTGGYEVFQRIEAGLAPPSGKHDYYFVFRGGSAGAADLYDVDAVEFTGTGVTVDTTAPTLVSASADRDPSRIKVIFSEPVTPVSAQDLSHYTASVGLTRATLQADRTTVVLQTSTPMNVGFSYNVAVNGVVDTYGLAVPGGSNQSFTFRGFDVAGGVDAIWQLDEASGTSAQDASGNGLTGTLTNGPTHTAGILGNAVTFDGVNDYIDVPDRSYAGDFTVAAWVYLTGTIGNEDAIVGQPGLGQDINFYGGHMRLYGPGDSVVAGTAMPVNTWTHCAIVRTNGTVRAYTNGREDGSATFTDPFIPKVLAHGNAGYLGGSLDDVRFYARALSASEVGLLADATASDLVARWAFDDGSGLWAKDTSGYAADGALLGGPTWETGIRGGALDFDGLNDQVDFPDITLSTDFTIAGFVKLTGAIDNTDALVGQNGIGSDINFWAARPRLYSVSAGDVVVASTAVTANEWTHVAVTRTAGIARVYIDGLLDATAAAAWTSPFVIKNIGHGNAGFFGGTMDDLRVYKRALSDAEIDALATAQNPGLVGHWALDDGIGTNATDSSYNSNTAALTGATWTTAGQSRGALTLNGTTGWANPTDIALGTGDFTIASWVKMTGTIDNQDAIVGQAGAGNDINFWAQKPRLYSSTDGDVVVASQTVPASVWAHVAVTRRDGRVRLYRDGVKDFTAPATACWFGSMPVAAIGRGNAGFFGGTLDDVRIYNTALRGSEIKHMSDDFPSRLLANYLFNDGTASDATGNGNTGVLVNGPVGVTGKVGGALQFDGVNDWVNIPDLTLSDFTIAFWVNLDAGITNADGVVGQEGPGADFNFFGGYLRMYAGGVNVAVSSVPVAAGVWSHWTVTRQGSIVRIFKDTTEVASGSYAGSFTVKAIGRGNAGFLGGKIDDLRIYTRAISDAEL